MSLASPDYTLDTPHTNKKLEPMEAPETRTASPSPALPPDLSARVIEAMALPPPSFRKRYQGTSDPILDTKKEGDTSESEGTGSESEELEDMSTDFESDEAASEDQQQTIPVEGTTAEEPLGLGYGVARRRALELAKYTTRNTFEAGQSSRSVTDQQKAYETPTPSKMNPSVMRGLVSRTYSEKSPTMVLMASSQIFYDHVDYTTQMAIDYVAGGRLGKVRPKEGWKTIEDLA
nr:hypothetical protein [Tanacetum cinerariifolium]